MNLPSPVGRIESQILSNDSNSQLQLANQEQKFDVKWDELMKLLRGKTPLIEGKCFASTNKPHDALRNHDREQLGQLRRGFDGEDPKGWIRKSNMFYTFQPILDQQKVDFVALHLFGTAETWYQSYILDKFWVDWKEFTVDVLTRFEGKGGKGLLDD